MSDPFAARNVTTVNMAGTSVMLGMPAGRDLPIHTVKSILGTMAACSERGVQWEFGAVANSAVIQWARDEVVDIFLKSKCNVLFWVDSDMVWEPWQFLRMLVWTQMYDVVCAAYPAKLDRVTFYVLRDEPSDRNEHGLVEINGTGLGFVAMRRSVVEKLAEQAPKVIDQIAEREIASVFRIDSVNRHRRGEDMAFFADIRALGYKVLLDPSVDLGHVGPKVYRGSIMDALHPA